MKIIKISYVAAAMLMISTTAFGQVNFGGKINMGGSWVSSENLRNNLEFQMSRDSDIRDWNVSYRPGIMIGIGGVANYTLTERMSLQGELSLNYQQSTIKINYIEDSRGTGGNGDTEEIYSEAKINSARLSVPITFHYSIGSNKPTLIAGLEANFLNTPQIESRESEIDNEFENSVLVQQQTDSKSYVANLDVFNTMRFNFLLGVAKSVSLGGKQLSLQLTYHLPLSTSAMYNFDNRVGFDDNSFQNNEVFGALGKIDAEQEAPAFPLNDFRMHFLDFSITYMF